MSSRDSLTAPRQGKRSLRGIAAATGKMQVLIGCSLQKQLPMTVKVLKPFFVNLKLQIHSKSSSLGHCTKLRKLQGIFRLQYSQSPA